MKAKVIRRLIAFVAVTAACMPAVAGDYYVIDLGTLGGSASASLSINDRGQVVGGSTTTGDTALHAFIARLGERGPVLQDLGTILGGTISQAWAINAKGQIAAAAVLDGHITALLLYTGTAKPIGTLGGASSVARGLNNQGEVVGYSAVAGDSEAHAFVFSHGNLLDLGTLGGTNSTANAINNGGAVVGNSETSSPGVTEAFIYRGGGLRSLGTLGGKNSYAVAINEEGLVVGSANTADGTTHAFLFDDGNMRDLGTLGGNNSDAFGINENAEIVGRAQFATGDPRTHAFFLGRCQMIDLNSSIPSDSGWVLQEARAINENGEIVGIGQHQGQAHSFLLVPKDESEQSAAERCDAGDQRQGGGK